MSNLEKLQINDSGDSATMVQLGCAVGAYAMLKTLEPALSDGTRHGSSLCANQLQQLPQIRQQLTSEIEKTLGKLGLSASLSTSNIQTANIGQSNQ